MSKSNSIKKLNSKRLSPANPDKPKQIIKKSSLSNPNKNKASNEQPGIIEVYEDNFIEEIKHLSSLLDEYNYIGMDTEFPGTVFFAGNDSEDFYYQALKKKC